ncbi:hypothetical protein DFP74_5166 [Nocardiopsis sp. Huas11]|uniref:hypothetical protein n=1 Tax=Nocardiopsis sp. Huas11 TaxID=2183912 RepID=UPI000F14CA80|nr:hypothetical protein [Nocardiopsis sp. Huas11]RKS09429.1 hypothetical protein DFP74_5166 [Nocardiopsis sp. Huas11]
MTSPARRAPRTRALLPASASALAALLALTACGGGEDAPDPAEESAPTEEAQAEEPAEGEDEQAAEEITFPMPEDCADADAETVALGLLPADAELVSEKDEDEGFRCTFGSRDGGNGVVLAYSEGFSLSDMPDIEDNFETVAEMRDRELYMTDRSREYSAVLEAVDAGDLEQESDSVVLHLPGGVFVQVFALSQTTEDMLSRDEIDEAAVVAAEALL